MVQQTKPVKIGNITVGGGQRVAIQSMLALPPQDIKANLVQASQLVQAGCDILRVAVPTMEAIELVKALKREISIPLVADIHYDYRLALASVEAGVDKIRLNPGNLPKKDQVAQVARACASAGIPIRVGANSGSIPADLLEQTQGQMTPELLVQAALRQVFLLEEQGFEDIVVSLKASHVSTTVQACRILADCCSYPQHIGVTEAGTARMGLVKSAVGIGSLLLDGIGDTMRVSLTADPIEEIRAAEDILMACGMSNDRVEVISCPTCGRCQVDLFSLAEQVEELVAPIRKKLTVAVMGCTVNGVGEGKQADIGIAGGQNEFLLFKKGVPVCKYPSDKIFEVLKSEIERL